MNNLTMAQEAALVAGAHDCDCIALSFPALRVNIWPARSGYVVFLGDDTLPYSFADLAAALDFACDEARLAE